ncbi:MAG: purine-binding chemotaxis protein CheW [Bacteroidales bacterium]|nr:purine-binding chemotaxis protein CheW [Bacteroidales bacterium]
MSQSFLRYKLHKELFAVPVTQVLKILEMGPLTSVPKSPPYLKGVLNWRGSILPVVDFNLKIGFPEQEPTRDSCILVLDLHIDNETLTVGCIVDQVDAVMEISTDKILSSPSVGEKFKSDLIKGMYPHDEEFIIILDYNKIFGSDEVLNLSKNSFKENK